MKSTFETGEWKVPGPWMLMLNRWQGKQNCSAPFGRSLCYLRYPSSGVGGMGGLVQHRQEAQPKTDDNWPGNHGTGAPPLLIPMESRRNRKDVRRQVAPCHPTPAFSYERKGWILETQTWTLADSSLETAEQLAYSKRKRWALEATSTGSPEHVMLS